MPQTEGKISSFWLIFKVTNNINRSGLERDTENYVSLVRDIRTFWTAHSNGVSVSLKK